MCKNLQRAEPRSVYLHMHLSEFILAEDAPAEILRSVTISFSFTRAGSKVLQPPVTNFLKNELWNEENSVTFKTKPAFLILSVTILPAKATKGPAIAVYSGKDLSWDTQDVFVLHFEVSPFCSVFFQSRFRVGHCCGSKPGKVMMYMMNDWGPGDAVSFQEACLQGDMANIDASCALLGWLHS